jgi:hypothetical protein
MCLGLKQKKICKAMCCFPAFSYECKRDGKSISLKGIFIMKTKIKNKIRLTQEQKKIAEKWRQKHGAATFDFKGRNIILHDGGLFSIEQKPVMRHKIIGFKKCPEININGKKIKGCSEAIFSKRKYKDTDFYANLWFEELDEIITYLKSMSRMLRKLGFDPSRSIKWMKKK